MSEETEDASKTVPRMILLTIALNGLAGFVFIITYVGFDASLRLRCCGSSLNNPQCFCITDLEAVLASEWPFPFIDVSTPATFT